MNATRVTSRRRLITSATPCQTRAPGLFLSIPITNFSTRLKKFQNEHGLFPDGALRPGGETEGAINAALTRLEENGAYYAWRTARDGKVRPAHAAREGQVFRWDEDLPGGDPGEDFNCRCWAEPLYAGYKPPPLPQRKPEVVAGQPQKQNLYPDAIKSVYPVEVIVGAAAGGALSTATKTYKILEAKRLETIEKLNRDLTWKLGKHKSSQKWENRMESRKWTEQQITDTIKNGKKYPAPNNVNKGSEAARYDYKGRFVVRDEMTKEILQISDENFIPNEAPHD